MPKQSLNKSINASKLHRRTMNKLPEQETTIPFGAILDDIKMDRDTVTFEYLSEPYSCPREIFLSASAVAKEAKATPAAEPEKVKLLFEGLSSNVGGLSRAKVPGGWLIASSGSVTFYPDPTHEWNGESE